MKTIKQLTNKCSALLRMLFCAAIVFSSCGSDDEDALGGVDPDKNVADPVGTVTLSMRDTKNGGTYLDNIQIENENFTGWNCYFASVGAVKGLGNVANIPTTGWASQVAVIPGNGYVAYNGVNFYRLYVTDYITATSGGIIGADVKYQKPFKGKDESISLDVETVTIPAEGGTQTVLFKNQGLIVFDITSKKFQVEKASTNDFFFLADGIAITAEPNYATSAIEDSITLTTAYGKKTVLKVIQAGATPYISLDRESLTFTAASSDYFVGLYANIDYSTLSASSSATWCTLELYDFNPYEQAQAKKVKFIGNQPVKATREAHSASTSYSLYVLVDPNPSAQPREATIIVKSKDGRASDTLKVVQDGYTFEVETDTVRFDKYSNYRTITITSNKIWAAESSEEWCTCTKNGNQLTIRTTETTEDRTAIISFKGFEDKIQIIVNQSKYAVGDNYKEEDIEGTVVYIGDEGRYITLYLGTASWSAEDVLTGAQNKDHGEYNMSIIKKIPNWEINYPAFKLCDDLNVNGVSGWYLPAINECKLIKSNNYSWSSTETDISSAYYYHPYTINKWAESTKRKKQEVYAVRKF